MYQHKFGVFQIGPSGALTLIEGGFFSFDAADEACAEQNEISIELGIHNKYVVREQRGAEAVQS